MGGSRALTCAPGAGNTGTQAQGAARVLTHALFSPRLPPPPPQANAATLLWNGPGTAVLALTAADVDATNQSYYGEQKLYFLAADGSNECAVPLPKVSWAAGGLGGLSGDRAEEVVGKKMWHWRASRREEGLQQTR